MLKKLGLGQSYLNIRITDHPDVETSIVERPGIWMNPTELEELVQNLRTVAMSLNVGSLDYGVLSGEKKSLDRCVVTLITRKSDRKPVAFNALSILSCHMYGRNLDVIHLGLVIVDPQLRAKGISWILYGLTTFLLFFRNRLRPIWISNVTQVPAILGMVSESFRNVFPNPRDNTKVSYEHLMLARQIMTFHRDAFGVGEDAEFDETNFIIKNAYTGGSDHLKKTFDQATKHRVELYNEYSRTMLDFERGDDFLQLGMIDLKTYYHYLSHNIPRGSRVILLYRSIFLLIEAIFMPIIYWFSPSRQYGELRPWK